MKNEVKTSAIDIELRQKSVASNDSLEQIRGLVSSLKRDIKISALRYRIANNILENIESKIPPPQ